MEGRGSPARRGRAPQAPAGGRRIPAESKPRVKPIQVSDLLRRSGDSTSFPEGRSGRRARRAPPHRGRGMGRARSRTAGCTRLPSHCPGCRIRSWHDGSPHSVPSGYRKSRTTRWSLKLPSGGNGGSKLGETQVASLALAEDETIPANPPHQPVQRGFDQRAVTYSHSGKEPRS